LEEQTHLESSVSTAFVVKTTDMPFNSCNGTLTTYYVPSARRCKPLAAIDDATSRVQTTVVPYSLVLLELTDLVKTRRYGYSMSFDCTYTQLDGEKETPLKLSLSHYAATEKSTHTLDYCDGNGVDLKEPAIHV